MFHRDALLYGYIIIELLPKRRMRGQIESYYQVAAELLPHTKAMKVNSAEKKNPGTLYFSARRAG